VGIFGIRECKTRRLKAQMEGRTFPFYTVRGLRGELAREAAGRSGAMTNSKSHTG
jgi:hypothetical protein